MLQIWDYIMKLSIVNVIHVYIDSDLIYTNWYLDYKYNLFDLFFIEKPKIEIYRNQNSKLMFAITVYSVTLYIYLLVYVHTSYVYYTQIMYSISHTDCKPEDHVTTTWLVG